MHYCIKPRHCISNPDHGITAQSHNQSIVKGSGAMPSKQLTEEGVRKLKPPPMGKQIDYFDKGMPGLVLRVNYGGRKTWRALYYVKGVGKDGKRRTEPRTHPLGLYPHLNVKEAREKARVFCADPQKALAQADAGSFKEVAENFIKRHVEASKLRSQPEIERCLERYIYPRWANRPFLELKRRDVADLLDEVEDKHGPRQADVCLAIISKMTNWYQSRNDDYVSPVVRGMRRSNGSEHKRKRTLDDEEIHAVWKGADEMGTLGGIVKLLLLTAQRREKVATMKWDDVKDGVWTIATEPREKGTPGVLKLPPLALAVIEAQPRIAGNPYVFAGQREQQRHKSSEQSGPPAFNSFAQRKGELDERLPKMPPWVLQDLRRTARSLMARAGVRPDIAERVLGHANPGVEGVYDRHHYADEKADALNRLAAHIDRIINPPPPNVVPLDKKKRKRA
jgi:integrase